MCRHGCPVDDFCIDFKTAREAAPAIQRHRWDKVPTDGPWAAGTQADKVGRQGIVKLFGNGCGAVDVSGLGGER